MQQQMQHFCQIIDPQNILDCSTLYDGGGIERGRGNSPQCRVASAFARIRQLPGALMKPVVFVNGGRKARDKTAGKVFLWTHSVLELLVSR